MLSYLSFPRPGPYGGVGKIAFFFLGSLIALAARSTPHGFRAWLAVFILYELVLSQGKYLLNDYAGRHSDRRFVRGARNRFPRGERAAVVVLTYALLRAAVGVAGLLIVAGPIAATLGALTILLQAAYELIKVAPLPRRGLGLFLAVSANYGVRALAGMVAVAPAAALGRIGLLGFGWAMGAGALFLSIYWERQGAYYLEGDRASADLLARHKPGVLAVYRLRRAGRASGAPPLPRQLLRLLVAWSAAFVVACPSGMPFASAILLCSGLAALAMLTYAVLSSGAAAPALGVQGKPHAA